MSSHMPSRLLNASVAVLLVVVFAADAVAEDIRYIQVGQRYYWAGVLYDELVLVTAVDRNGGRIQVTREDGEVVWLKPSQLITREKSTENDMARVGIGAAIITAAIGSTTKPPSSTTPARAAAPPAAGAFSLCNKTTKGVLYSAVAYQTGEGWKVYGWYPLAQGSCRDFSGAKGDRLLYFANDSSSRTWAGDIPTCVHPKNAFTLHYGKTCSAPYEARSFVSKTLGSGHNVFHFVD